DAEIADVDIAGRPRREQGLTGRAAADPAGEDEEESTDDQRRTAGGEQRGVEDQPEVGLGHDDVEQGRGAGIEDELRDDLLSVGTEHPAASEDESGENDSGDDGETFEYGQHGLLVVLASCDAVIGRVCQWESAVSGCRRSRADSLRLCAVGDDIGRGRADRTDCEDCRPGADLLRQGMGSPEPGEVSETQPGGGRPALLRIPGPGGVGTRRGEDDSAERADPGLPGGEETADESDGDERGGGDFVCILHASSLGTGPGGPDGGLTTRNA